MAVARIAVSGHGKAQPGALDAQHRGVAAGLDHGRVADHVVVAAEHAAAAGQVGAREQSEQRRARVGERGKRVDDEVEGRFGCDAHQTTHRSPVGQQLDRQASHRVRPVNHRQLAVVGDFADYRGGQVPGVEDALHLALAAALDDDQHPLLRFGKHHVVRCHLALPPRHQRDVEARPRARHAARAFGHGRRESRRTKVLDRDHSVGMREVHARFEQALLQERVAHLDGRPAFRAALIQLDGRERCAMDSVASGIGPYQHQPVARSLGAGTH